MEKQFKFRNITISGKIATGTTTLLENLKPYFEPHGWIFYSGGQFVREYVKKNGLKLEKAEDRGDDFARTLDVRIRNELNNKKNLIIESWLAGYDAKGIKDVLKVLLVCPDDGVIVDRVVNRDNVTVSEAKDLIRQRTTSNIAKWERIYGKKDFWDPKYYDLIIDTYSNGPSEVVEKVLKKMRFNDQFSNPNFQ